MSSELKTVKDFKLIRSIASDLPTRTYTHTTTTTKLKTKKVTKNSEIICQQIKCVLFMFQTGLCLIGR